MPHLKSFYLADVKPCTKMSDSDQKILVAPLNWGLGHATRCIPIIRALLACGYTPILASDGQALALLKKEFPNLTALELPSYDIEYARDGADFKWKMIKNLPKMIDAIRLEKKMIRQWVKDYDLCGIISDNRPGVFSKKIPSVFITHQLRVLSGNTTWISSKLHQHIIKKFEECWVPDFESSHNLSGKLGHLKKPDDKIKYIGPLSRFEKKSAEIQYDLMVLLSGPEPQRGILEERLRQQMGKYDGRVIFICGSVEEKQKTTQVDGVTYYNFMTSTELEKTFNQSAFVLARSGYTTLMDLVKLEKKAFFIPTPGQYEQEYLAKKMRKNGWFLFAKQDDFRFSDLTQGQLYHPPKLVEEPVHWKNLFCLFEK
jgi:uncharacterized protein (TIGR00661 family)